jgi:hypothetical protein
MTSPDASLAAPLRLRCSHCGRPVRETLHTRSSYCVDYYSMHTGSVELSSVSRHDSDETFSYLKLIDAAEIISCADCYRDPRVRRERERLFRPECVAAEES